MHRVYVCFEDNVHVALVAKGLASLDPRNWHSKTSKLRLALLALTMPFQTVFSRLQPSVSLGQCTRFFWLALRQVKNDALIEFGQR
jgi:hypothetical protein